MSLSSICRPRCLLLAMASVSLLGAPAAAQLVQTVDYSDTFTLGVNGRANGVCCDPVPYAVEDTHGNPASTWTPQANYSFNDIPGSFGTGPTVLVAATGNPGAETGIAQSGGGDFSFAYGLRTDYVVEMDAFLSPGDRTDMSSVPSPGDSIFAANSLSVFFRRTTRGTGMIGIFNGAAETAVGSTGLDDDNWHRLAVHFNQDAGRLAIYVDGIVKADLDLTTFAGGVYQNYSNGAVGAGGAGAFVDGKVLWFDNFQVGEPAPPPTSACFTASATEGTVPLAVDFDGACSFFSGSAQSYDWAFGDGGTASGATASHTYTLPGNYTATLTVTDTNASTDTASKAITVHGTASSYADDFNRADGPIDGWSVYSVPDTWNIAAGELMTGPTGQERWIWAGDPALIFPARMVLEFDMRFLSAGTFPIVGRHAGAVFCGSKSTHRYDAGFSGYFVDWIDRTDDHGLRLTRVDNGVLAELVAGAPGSPAEPPLTWRVEITGQNIRVYGDGTLYIDVIDSNYRGGFAGLWTWEQGQELAYDNFSVSVPANPLTACFTTGGPEFPLAGNNVELDSTCTENVGAGTITARDWDFGDGMTGSGAAVSHPYAAPGRYAVKLTVKDSLGNESESTRIVTVYQAALSYSDDFQRAAGPVTGWSVHSVPGTWNISDAGELVTGPTGEERWIWAGDTPIVAPHSATYEWDQVFVGPGSVPAIGRHGGFVFCANKPTHRLDAGFSGYFVDWIDRAEDRGLRLSRVDSGVFHEIIRGVASGQVPPDEPPVVWRVEVDHDHIRLLGDGVQYFDVVDDTHRGGLFGFWTWAGGQELSFDNLNVTGEEVTACFTTTTQVPVQGDLIGFKAGCSEAFLGTAASYEWDFGDGGTVSGAEAGTASHTYAAAGDYTVKLTVKNAGNASDTFERTWTVSEPLLPFADCFERAAGPVDGWTVDQGVWTLNGVGQLSAMVTGQEFWLWAGAPPLPTSQTFVAEYDIQFLANPLDGVGRHAGAAFCATAPTHRYDPAFDGYFVDWIDRPIDRGPRFTRVDNGALVELVRGVADITVPIPPDPPLTWRIEVDATNIRVYGDGVLYIDIAEQTYRGGYFGLWSYLNGQDLLYDNVRIGASELPGCDVTPPEPRFVRGDTDTNGKIGLTDAVRILLYLFAGGEEPACFDAADGDDSGQLQLTDAVRILNWLFLGNAVIPPPSPSTTEYAPEDCGIDPAIDPPDPLDCKAFGPCE